MLCSYGWPKIHGSSVEVAADEYRQKGVGERRAKASEFEFLAWDRLKFLGSSSCQIEARSSGGSRPERSACSNASVYLTRSVLKTYIYRITIFMQITCSVSRRTEQS